MLSYLKGDSFVFSSKEKSFVFSLKEKSLVVCCPKVVLPIGANSSWAKENLEIAG